MTTGHHPARASGPVDLQGLRPPALVELLAARGHTLTLGQARRIFAHVVGRGQPLATLPRLAASTRAAVAEATTVQALEVVEVAEADDGFTKWLLRCPDGAMTEAVRIPLAREGRFSVCLSSQVGCAMACDFCATGRLGFSRNLAPWEMVAAFRAVREATEGRVASAVFMGQGEPFQNYDAVLEAAAVLSHPNGGGIGKRSITISTVGLVGAIRRFTAEGHPYRLIVSLHTADPVRRRRLLPVAGQLDITDLASAIREHAAANGEPVTVAWTLIAGINDDPSEVEALRALLGDTPVIINLIDVNDARPDGYRRSSRLEAMRDALGAAGFSMRRRYSGGGGRHAACGMLAARETLGA